MQGKMEGKRKREKAEDEMVGLYHQLNGHEFEQNLGDSGGQRSLGLLQSMGLATQQHQQQFPCYKQRRSQISKKDQLRGEWGKTHLGGKENVISCQKRYEIAGKENSNDKVFNLIDSDLPTL